MESSNVNRKSLITNKRKSNIPQPSSSKKSFVTPGPNFAQRLSSATPSTSRLSTYGRFPRKSTCATPADRLSSVGIKKKDPRQLENKSMMKKSINKLFHFLIEQGFNNVSQHTFSPQTMNPPTNRLFINIFTFLANFIDNEFKIIGKPEECMLNFLNCYGYPFMITKSHLHNVGTLSSWPHALGVLDWLMKLIKINLNFVTNPDCLFKLSEKDSCLETKHLYLKECYMEYMKGNDGPYDEALAKAEKIINEQNKDLIDEAADSSNRLKEVKKEHEELVKEKKKIEHSIKSRKEMNENIEEMDKYILDMKEYLSKKENMMSERRKHLNELKTEIKSEEKRLQSIKSTVSFQKYNSDDVKRMSKEVKELAEKIEEVKKEIGSVVEENYRYNSKNQKLQEMIKGYHVDLNKKIEEFFDKLIAIDFNLENHKIQDYLVKIEADVKTNLKTVTKFMSLVDEANLFYIRKSDEVLQEITKKHEQLHESSSKVIEDQIAIRQKEELKKELMVKNEEEKKKLELANQETKEMTRKIKMKEKEVERCLEDGKIKIDAAELELKELKTEVEIIADENKKEMEEMLISHQKIADEKMKLIEKEKLRFSEKIAQETQQLENSIKENEKKQKEMDLIDLEGTEKQLKEMVKKTQEACKLNDEEKELLDYIVSNVKKDETS